MLGGRTLYDGTPINVVQASWFILTPLLSTPPSVSFATYFHSVYFLISRNEVSVTCYPPSQGPPPLSFVLLTYRSGGCLVTAAPIRETEGLVKRPQTRTFHVGFSCVLPSLLPLTSLDFLLVRNQPRGPTPATDRSIDLPLINPSSPFRYFSLHSYYVTVRRRHVLYGFMVGNVPAINSLQSLYLDLERAAMFS